MKKIIKMLLCSMLLVLLTGCTGNGKYQVDAGKLKDSSGEYQFEDLAWGSSVSETEALLGTTLNTGGKVEEREIFQAEKTFGWDDVEGNVICEFAEGALDTVSIMFRPEEEEQFWSDLRDKLFSLYGEVEADVRSSTSEELKLTTESETYLWEASGERRTVLSLRKLSTNGEFKYIELSVYVIPEGK